MNVFMTQGMEDLFSSRTGKVGADSLFSFLETQSPQFILSVKGETQTLLNACGWCYKLRALIGPNDF